MDPLHRMKEHLICAVCMETFRDPKMLPCLHSFCTICLQSIIQSLEQREFSKRRINPSDPQSNKSTKNINGIHHEIQSFECPTCRETVSLKQFSKGIYGLPSNIWIVGMVDAMNETHEAQIVSSSKDSSDTSSIPLADDSNHSPHPPSSTSILPSISFLHPPPSCQLCSEDEDENEKIAASKCLQCCLFLCSIHHAAHSKSKETRYHQYSFISISSSQDKEKLSNSNHLKTQNNSGESSTSNGILSPSISSQKSRSLKCKEHEDEEIKLFCETCQLCICRDCALVDHREHKFIFLDKSCEEHRKKLGERLKDANNSIHAILKMEQKINDLWNLVRSNSNDLVLKIREIFDQMRNEINEREQQLLIEVETSRQERLIFLQHQRESLEQNRQTIQSSYSSSSIIHENATDVELLMLQMTIIKRFDDLKLSIDIKALEQKINFLHNGTFGNQCHHSYFNNNYHHGNSLGHNQHEKNSVANNKIERKKSLSSTFPFLSSNSSSHNSSNSSNNSPNGINHGQTVGNQTLQQGSLHPVGRLTFNFDTSCILSSIRSFGTLSRSRDSIGSGISSLTLTNPSSLILNQSSSFQPAQSSSSLSLSSSINSTSAGSQHSIRRLLDRMITPILRIGSDFLISSNPPPSSNNNNTGNNHSSNNNISNSSNSATGSPLRTSSASFVNISSAFPVATPVPNTKTSTSQSLTNIQHQYDAINSSPIVEDHEFIEPWGIAASSSSCLPNMISHFGPNTIVIADASKSCIFIENLPTKSRMVDMMIPNIDKFDPIPYAVAIDSISNKVYISDLSNNCIKFIDLSTIGGNNNNVGNPCWSSEMESNNSCNSIISTQNINPPSSSSSSFITNSFNSSSNPIKIDSFGSSGIQIGQFNRPTGIAIERRNSEQEASSNGSNNGNNHNSESWIWIVDAGNGRVQAFELETKSHRATFAGFDEPNAITYDPLSQRMIVTDKGAKLHMLQRNSQTVRVTLQIKNFPNFDPDLPAPTGITTDLEGNAIIVDSYSNKVLVIRLSDGVIVGQIGNQESFKCPRCVLFFPPSGTLLISDKHRVQGF